MRILVTGSSGLVGSQLVPFLTAGGHEVLRLVRREPRGTSEVQWDTERGVHDPSRLEDLDAVVHLAGAGIADKRWTDAHKRLVLSSRVDGTRKLIEALGGLQRKPKTFVSASAIGWYGDRGDEVLTEESSEGSGYLTDVCKAWEAESSRAADHGMRVVQLRIGVILSPAGGALKKMLLPFKMGGGGILGDGKQWMSWVALDDVVGAIHHALATDSLSGPVNLTAPNPVSNHGFTKALGRVLWRPTLVPMPRFAVKLAFGEMGETLLLGSQRVLPVALERSGYEFAHRDLEGALRHLLGAEPAEPSTTAVA